MTAKIWKAVSGACQITLEGHKGSITSVASSADGSFIVTASTDHSAKVWCAKRGALLHTLQEHSKGVCAASFSRNGSFIVTGSSDNSAKVWNFSEKGVECALTLRGHGDGIRSAAF